MIERELKAMKKSGKKKKTLVNGEVVEEAGDESSVDSLMAESPAKYNKAGVENVEKN